MDYELDVTSPYGQLGKTYVVYNYIVAKLCRILLAYCWLLIVHLTFAYCLTLAVEGMNLVQTVTLCSLLFYCTAYLLGWIKKILTLDRLITMI